MSERTAGILLALVIGVPWAILMARAAPHFLAVILLVALAVLWFGVLADGFDKWLARWF